MSPRLGDHRLTFGLADGTPVNKPVAWHNDANLGTHEAVRHESVSCLLGHYLGELARCDRRSSSSDRLAVDCGCMDHLWVSFVTMLYKLRSDSSHKARLIVCMCVANQNTAIANTRAHRV